VRVPMPSAARDARVREGATRDVQVRVEDGHAAAALERGEYLLEWQR